MWVAALAVAVLAGGVGVAFAASSRSSAPHHNSRGCVPTNDDTHSLAPDSCGPGNYPLSAILDGQALNITLVSNAGNLDFGLVGCRRSVPHLQRLLAHLESSLKDLEAAVGV